MTCYLVGSVIWWYQRQPWEFSTSSRRSRAPRVGDFHRQKGAVMEISVGVDHKVEEHIQAERLYYSKRSRFASVDKLVAGLLLLIGIGLVWLVGVRWWSLIWFALAPLEFFNLLSIAPLVLRYRFARNPKFRELNQISFGEEEIHFRTTSIDSKLKWDLYDGVLENEQLILLTYGGQMYSVIPKRCFKDPGSLEAFRSLVSSKVRGSKTGAPGDVAGV